MSPETFRKRVARRIQRARWRLGLTQAEAAHRIGLTPRYFAELERAHLGRNPSLAVLLAISTAFKVTVADLVDVQVAPRVDLDALSLKPPKT
ncbi:MAG: helix-turn-helix transcriptional regulator, partial [Polyangiaceae bacterium]|nr:helix-turn-helix transcriptional regulator [Polyangiaceae bacterium]